MTWRVDLKELGANLDKVYNCSDDEVTMDMLDNLDSVAEMALDDIESDVQDKEDDEDYELDYDAEELEKTLTSLRSVIKDARGWIESAISDVNDAISDVVGELKLEKQEFLEPLP